MAKSDRISFQLPAVPHSLRAFIEKAVRDQHCMLAFVESPITALRAAGVPIQTECLTKADCDRLVRVLGKLRNLVASGKLTKDFRFEDVLVFDPSVAYQSSQTLSDSFTEKNFDHSTDGHDSEQKSSTDQGIKNNFQNSGITQKFGDDIIAPLISPGDLAAIVTLMQAKINLEFGR